MRQFDPEEAGYGMGYYCVWDPDCNMRTIDQDKISVDEDTCECKAASDLIIPKQDWITRLIWNMGLEGTEYDYSDLDCAKSDFNQVEIFNCGLCPDQECETIFDEALKAEFIREFEEVSPAKLQALTGYPWMIKLKDLYVNVVDQCTGESREVTYSTDYSFDSAGGSQVAGLPIQFLFAEKSDFNVDSPYSCEVCKFLSTVGALCISGVTDDACDCTYNAAIGEILQCNSDNICCPSIYMETLRDADGNLMRNAAAQALPCCTMVDEGICYDEEDIVTHKYKCYAAGETTADCYEVRESCYIEEDEIYGDMQFVGAVS
jgi:hypothetical protein